MRLAWDPNPEPNIAGYRIYYGVYGEQETNRVEVVGKISTGTVTNLDFSTIYWFYVTAYNTFALESDPSDTLYHQTRATEPLDVVTETPLLAIAPAQLKLKAQLTGDAQSPTGPTVSWQQVSGPATMSVAQANTLTPVFNAEVPGTYGIRLRVVDGTTTLERMVELDLWSPLPPGNTNPDAPILATPFFLPDGIVLSWNSVPTAYYMVLRKETLEDNYWVILVSRIPSQGAITYWIDDRLELYRHAFFTVLKE